MPRDYNMVSMGGMLQRQSIATVNEDPDVQGQIPCTYAKDLSQFALSSH